MDAIDLVRQWAQRIDGASLALGLGLGALVAAAGVALFARLQRRAALAEAVGEVERERVRLAQALEDERARGVEGRALLDTAEARLREAFARASMEALDQGSRRFLELAKASFSELQTGASADLEQRRQAIDALVAPLRESLGRVDAKLGEIEKARAEHYGALTQQLAHVASAHQKLEGETRRLVDALKRPEARGRWGEIQLRRVVELADMLPHVDFVEQETLGGEDGRLRPDLIVRLPGGQSVVVDAKAPLDAYLRALEAPDDGARAASLRDHARQVRDHMTKLSAKAYFERIQPAPEFVVMFLPGEAFFSAALQHDPALIELGVAQRVIPASPTTLIALLRAAYYGWRQERLAENAQAVSALGRELHERIAKLAEHFGNVGDALGRAVRAYDQAVGSLESRVLVSARRFEELGAAKEGLAIEPPETLGLTPRTLVASSAPGREEGESAEA